MAPKGTKNDSPALNTCVRPDGPVIATLPSSRHISSWRGKGTALR